MKVNRLRKLTIEVKNFKSLNRDIMHTYFKKGSRSVSRKMAKTLQSSNLEFSTRRCRIHLKHGRGLNANVTPANTRVTHITILELYTLT